MNDYLDAIFANLILVLISSTVSQASIKEINEQMCMFLSTHVFHIFAILSFLLSIYVCVTHTLENIKI
jgi:hypothetical protein